MPTLSPIQKRSRASPKKASEPAPLATNSPTYNTPVSNKNNDPRGVRGPAVASRFDQEVRSFYLQDRLEIGDLGLVAAEGLGQRCAGRTGAQRLLLAVVGRPAGQKDQIEGGADAVGVVFDDRDLDPARQPEVLDEAGIVFLFAQLYHPAMKNVAAVRRQLGIQTTFNFLGPLANPARPRAMALGVANDDIAPVVARVLAERGTRGMVFRGFDGLDELTTTTTSDVWLIAGGALLGLLGLV